MGKSLKISSTAYRVLFLMKLLDENAYNIDDLNKIFSLNSYIKRTLSKEVILKYLSTIRSAGYKISKPSTSNDYKYSLVQAPISIKFLHEDLETIVILESYVSSLYQKRLVELYNNFLNNILRYLSDEQISILNQLRKKHKDLSDSLKIKYEKYGNLIQKFERFCIEDQRIIVKYKFPRDDEQKEVVLEPKMLKYTQNKVYISGYNPIIGERQLINLSYVMEIKQLPIKSKHNNTVSPVIFSLKGRVAKGYRLYEDEKILETDTDSGMIRVAAYVDDKNMLLQRLLRYGDYCEVLYPKSLRQNVLNILQEAISNYN